MNLLDQRLWPDPKSINMVAPGPTRKPLSGFQILKDRLMGLPEGMEGLLSGEDVGRAQDQGVLGLAQSLLENSGPKRAEDRVPFTQAVGRGLQGGKTAYDQALAAAAGMRGAGMDFRGKKMDLEGKERAAGVEKRILEGRKKIGAAIPRPKGGDLNALAEWASQVYPYYLNIDGEGTPDLESLKELTTLLGYIGNKKKQNVSTVNRGGVTEFYDDETGQTLRTAPNSPAPYDPQRGAEQRALLENDKLARREMMYTNAYTKDITETREAHQNITGSLNNVSLALAGNGAAQLEIVNSFVKSLDPRTANKEGEVELARSAAPAMARAKNFLRHRASNESALAPPELIAEMEDLLKKRVALMEGYMGDRRKYWVGRAERAKIPESDLLFDEAPKWSGSSARRSLKEIRESTK